MDLERQGQREMRQGAETPTSGRLHGPDQVVLEDSDRLRAARQLFVALLWKAAAGRDDAGVASRVD